jgi:hypothetical protein
VGYRRLSTAGVALLLLVTVLTLTNDVGAGLG